jgi:uncharacterized protein (DUF427 family)
MLTQDLRIVAAEGVWVVRAGGAVIGESTRALELCDGTRPSEIYFPRDSIAMAFLEPADRTATSRSLGEARFFDLVLKSVTIPHAAWSYETPQPDAARLAGHIAFATDQVTIERV